MANLVWIAESFRATFFSAVTPRPAAKEWWIEVAGSAAESLVVNEGPPGYASASGQIERDVVLLQLMCQPGRIDWNYQIAMKPEPDGSFVLARQVSVEESIDSFLEMISRWIPRAPSCNRVALGCAARVPVATKEEGYRVLQSFLPAIQIDPIGSSDISYQVNRPRQSKSFAFPLSINRLSQWGVASVFMRAQATAPDQTNIQIAASSGLFAKVQIDINTPAENDHIFTQDEMRSVIRELRDLAVEILQNGDCP